MHINYAANLGFDFCLERGSRKKKKKRLKFTTQETEPYFHPKTQSIHPKCTTTEFIPFFHLAVFKQESPIHLGFAVGEIIIIKKCS